MLLLNDNVILLFIYEKYIKKYPNQITIDLDLIQVGLDSMKTDWPQFNKHIGFDLINTYRLASIQ